MESGIAWSFRRAALLGRLMSEAKMRKLGLALLVVLSLGLYLWLGGDKSPVSEPPGIAVKPPASPPVTSSLPLSRNQVAERRQAQAPVGHRPPTDGSAGYGGPSYAEGEGWNGSQGAPDAFRFRPWTENERLRLEREPSNPYTDSPLPPGRGYALYPPRSYAQQQPGYVPPQPGDFQYRFRPRDPAQEMNRWTGNFPPPNPYLPNAMPQQGELYPYQGRDPGSPWQKNSRAMPSGKSLWAARGLEL